MINFPIYAIYGVHEFCTSGSITLFALEHYIWIAG